MKLNPMSRTGATGSFESRASIRRGELDEGRVDELPFVFLGRITVSLEEINALEQAAFHFSGVCALSR